MGAYLTFRWLVAIVNIMAIVTKNVLDNPNRLRIYETVTRTPGIYKYDLIIQVELDGRTLDHHLEKLEKERMVFPLRAENKVRYYADIHAKLKREELERIKTFLP